MYNDTAAQIMHIRLKPGESLKPHKTPVNVAFYILDGNVTVHIGDERKELLKDNLVESPANIVHHLSNEGSIDARILVIKAPRPQNPSRVL